MEYEVISRIKLSEINGINGIYSCVPVNGYYGKSLAIAYHEAETGILRLIYVPLSHFSYSCIVGIPISPDFFKYIKITRYRDIDHSVEFTRASITKRIKY